MTIDRRKQYQEWATTTDVFMASGTPLVGLAMQDLEMAAQQAAAAKQDGRTPPFCAPRALSGALLLFASTESWLNHHLAILHFQRRKSVSQEVFEKRRKLIHQGKLWEKAQALPEVAGGHRLPFEAVADLKLATISVRHEITHDLPASNKRSDEDRLAALLSRGLTIEAPPDKDVTFTIHERLASFDLLYWCWKTVDEVIEHIFAADANGEILDADRINFQAYRRYPSPEQLANST